MDAFVNPSCLLHRQSFSSDFGLTSYRIGFSSVTPQLLGHEIMERNGNLKTFRISSSRYTKNSTIKRRNQNELMMISKMNEFSFTMLSSVTPNVISEFDIESSSRVFEPQINSPALFSFVIVATMFSLLLFRVNQVRDASVRREEALKFLRQVKSEQLDTSTFSSRKNNSGIDPILERAIVETNLELDTKSEIEERVETAIKAYETALKEELSLRTIIPGVRIVAPNDAARREEDIVAAKQFLDLDIVIDNDDENVITSESQDILDVDSNERNKKQLLLKSRRRFDGKDDIKNESTASSNEIGVKNMSNFAKAILLTVAVSQIALLFLLSFDPMVVSDAFSAISEGSPDEMPLSSWSKSIP